VRPKLRITLLAALALALFAAGGAAAASGGFEPVAPRSPNASGIRDVYWAVFGVAAFVFVLVEVTLVVFVLRFRSRGRSRDVEGPQIRGNTSLELAWTAGPVLLLAAIAAFVFYKLPGIKNVPAATAGSSQIEVKIEAHQFYWQFDYPGGAISIDRLVAPVNQVMRLTVVSPDVAHSWWIPALGAKIDAIPGRTNHTWFKPDREGVYKGQCAEFCGIQHAAMTAQVWVVTPDQYENFLAAHTPSSAAVGSEIVTGVCAKCHGFSGQGDVGPPIAGNALINDPKGLATLLRNGRPPTRTPDGMPAVGKTWSDDELNAAIAALQKTYGKAAASGG
jgi:cytochrome c oxidase subunit II